MSVSVLAVVFCDEATCNAEIWTPANVGLRSDDDGEKWSGVEVEPVVGFEERSGWKHTAYHGWRCPQHKGVS